MKSGVELEFLRGLLDSTDLEMARIRGPKFNSMSGYNQETAIFTMHYFFIKTRWEELIQPGRDEDERDSSLKWLKFIV